MPPISRRHCLALGAGAGMSFLAGQVEAASPIDVVVELFSSQGCSSCPPADRWASTLKGPAAQGRVVVQAFHVGYWDYIGWKDPFADAAWTQRQRQYSRALRTTQIYTPQMVIGGKIGVVGSDRRAVEAAIRKIAAAGKAAGVFSADPATAAAYQALGASFLLVGVDAPPASKVRGKYKKLTGAIFQFAQRDLGLEKLLQAP